MVRIFIGPVPVEREHMTKGIAQKASLMQHIEMKVTLVTFKTKLEMFSRSGVWRKQDLSCGYVCLKQ